VGQKLDSSSTPQSSASSVRDGQNVSKPSNVTNPLAHLRPVGDRKRQQGPRPARPQCGAGHGIVHHVVGSDEPGSPAKGSASSSQSKNIEYRECAA